LALGALSPRSGALAEGVVGVARGVAGGVEDRDGLALAVLGDGAGLARRIGVDGDEPVVGVLGGGLPTSRSPRKARESTIP
jgi:hypothetical protein